MKQSAMASNNNKRKRISAGYVGRTWVPRFPVATRWADVKLSDDGSKLIAVWKNATSTAGEIYTSTDFGVTWTLRNNSAPFAVAASSADGSKLAVGTSNNNYIYTSTDSGATWTQQTGSGARNWVKIASSSDGNKLLASDNSNNLYISTNSGVTWTQTGPTNQGFWRGLIVAANGSKLIASNNYIYTSTDSGATWTQKTAAWNSVDIASSADGNKLLAADNSTTGWVYTSTDFGVTWTQTTLNKQPSGSSWRLASSADGSKLIATTVISAVMYLYTSTDSGATWVSRTAPTGLVTVMLSSDGGHAVAIDNPASGGQLYTSNYMGT